jgi:ABC-type sugar transport system substrate-binding protein
MRRWAAVATAAALLVAIVAIGPFGGAAHSHRLEAGYGPVAASPPASGHPWWLCAVATEAYPPC